MLVHEIHVFELLLEVTFVKNNMIKLFNFDVGTWNSRIWTANWSDVSLIVWSLQL